MPCPPFKPPLGPAHELVALIHDLLERPASSLHWDHPTGLRLLYTKTSPWPHTVLIVYLRIFQQTCWFAYKPLKIYKV